MMSLSREEISSEQTTKAHSEDFLELHLLASEQIQVRFICSNINTGMTDI